MKEKEILTAKEVQKLLGISHQTRITWSKKGFLKPYTIGGKRVYYRLQDIEKAMVSITTPDFF
jgi:predicted site-specific integrase-resolvase